MKSVRERKNEDGKRQKERNENRKKESGRRNNHQKIIQKFARKNMSEQRNRIVFKKKMMVGE